MLCEILLGHGVAFFVVLLKLSHACHLISGGCSLAVGPNYKNLIYFISCFVSIYVNLCFGYDLLNTGIYRFRNNDYSQVARTLFVNSEHFGINIERFLLQERGCCMIHYALIVHVIHNVHINPQLCKLIRLVCNTNKFILELHVESTFMFSAQSNKISI